MEQESAPRLMTTREKAVRGLTAAVASVPLTFLFNYFDRNNLHIGIGMKSLPVQGLEAALIALGVGIASMAVLSDIHVRPRRALAKTGPLR